jgi:predicted GIY-YIG superfamily endonuclease
MLLRDRLIARLGQMGNVPDYPTLAAEVLGIRNAPPALAKRLVEQALVVEDRRDEWLRLGRRICEAAPPTRGVYVLRDGAGQPLYVGKANNLRRRLRTHFAARRWKALKADFARAVDAEWRETGSEIEALVREAWLIRELSPRANVQVGAPAFATRTIPGRLLRDTIVVLPSLASQVVELLAVRVSGPVMLVGARRDGSGLQGVVKTIWRFMPPVAGNAPDRSSHATTCRSADDRELKDVLDRAECPVLDEFAPVVFSWLAGRGAGTTRLDPHDAGSARELQRRLTLLLDDQRLFDERIVVLRSSARSSSART